MRSSNRGRLARLQPGKALQFEALESRAMFSAGDLDTTLGPQGVVTIPLALTAFESVGRCTAMTTDSKGRTLLVGNLYRGKGNNDFLIVRLTAQGLPDKTFGAAKNGRVVVGFEQGVTGDDRATCVAIDGKGRIIVGGDVDQLSGTAWGVVRLTPNGKVDTTFSGDGRAIVDFDAGGDGEDRASGIVADKAGRVIVVGTAQTDADSALMASRLTPRGKLDASFDGDGRKLITGMKKAPNTMPDRGTAVAIDAKQRIVFAGRWGSGGFGFFGVGRLKGDGTYDTTFAGPQGFGGFEAFSLSQFGGIGPDSEPTGLRFDGSGRIYVVGSIQRQTPSDYDIGLLRITDSGDLDSTFGFGGLFLVAFDLGPSKNDVAAGIAIDKQGRLVVSGTAKSSDMESELAIMRVMPTGQLDSSFAVGGKRTVKVGDIASAASGLRIDKLGRIVVAATVSPSNSGNEFALVRLLG